MIRHNYSRIIYDSCVYYRILDDGSIIMLVLYVDAMLIVSKCISEVQKLKSLLSKEFVMKGLGSARKILGMEIMRDHADGKLWLCQKSYIE